MFYYTIYYYYKVIFVLVLVNSHNIYKSTYADRIQFKKICNENTDKMYILLIENDLGI